MKLVTADQMRAIEERTARECRIPLLLLMEQAGRAVADAAAALLSPGAAAVVCAGKGNNGGDGLCAARLLLARGVPVSVLLFADPQAITGDAAINLEAARGAGVEVLVVDGPAGGSLPAIGGAHAAQRLSSAALIIDALLGTGATGAPRGATGEAVALINAAGRPVLAVDLPTGVEADSGATPGLAVRAAVTVTFALPKWGHYLYPGAGLCGRLTVADIGIPPRALAPEGRLAEVLTVQAVAGWLPHLPGDAHKGTRGRVLAIGGSLGMVGAAVLASRAALRAGCGTVRLLTPATIQAQAASHLVEVMVQPVPDNLEGVFAGELAAREVLVQAAAADVVVLGPGLSREKDAATCARSVLEKIMVPAVIDADGIVAFAGRAGDLRRVTAPLVLTPHPGELALLLGMSTTEVQADRPGALRLAVEVTGAVVVLKGAHSLIGVPGGQIYVNPTGNRGMGTGGSGDVLAGTIAGLLAQGMAPPEAAAAGVYLHGLAGDLAAARLGSDGLLAGDLIDELPLARRQVLEA